MTLAVLLLVVAVATLLVVFGRRRSGLAFYAIALVMFLAVGCGIAPRLLLANLQSGYGTEISRWSAHNDIVLLGAGAQRTEHGVELPIFSYGRLTRAFELYRDCKSHAVECHIISSGGDARRYGKSEADLYQAALLRLGAADSDLINESRSLNTWQNAQFTAQILQQHPAGTVVLVTSGLHSKRSAQYFSHFGVRTQPIRGDYAMPAVGLLPNAYNLLLMDLALHEYLGVLRYHVYNFLGWNIKAANPGAL
jgi:uncharacterized SAM-binding protein YcdF (DUF218 family)